MLKDGEHIKMIQQEYRQEYVTINGIEQYLLHYPQENKPVLLFLHGGPGGAEHLLAHYVEPYFQEIVTQVHWDQRGAGKTFLKNKQNKPQSVEQMLEDLHQVVKHLQKVYHVQKVVLLGHSFGSVLGSLYALQHPENVMVYIGAGQVINMMENEREGYLLAVNNAQKAGNQKQIRILEKLEGYPPKDKELLMKQLPKVRQISMKNSKNASELSASEQIKIASKSPCFHLSDAISLLNANKVNRQIIFQLLDFDLRSYSKQYQVPVHYIAGEQDITTPASITQKYFEEIEAPQKSCVIMAGAGHNMMYEKPEEFAKELKKLVGAVF